MPPVGAVTVFDVGITTLTNVDAISKLAYDIRDMDAYIKDGDYLNAKRVYDDGRNAALYDNFGNELEDFIALKNMGRAGLDGANNDQDAGLFSEDPSFLFQILGMMTVGQSIDESISQYAAYADQFITEQLNDVTAGNLGAQASTILTVQMHAMHQLWDGISDCFSIQNGFNPDADQTGNINPKKSFDNFIALYVGAGQTLGPEFDGDMLYAHAQVAASHFDTTNDNGEALVNVDVRTLYQSIQRNLSEDNYCTREETIEELWTLVNRIIAKMYIPLVQMLIHAMKNEDSSHMVRMYALAIIPQLSQCRPSIQRRLKSSLLDRKYDKQDFSRILSLLQQSYDCLGFSCEDVGAYEDAVVAECAGYDADHALAGFVPKEDVRTLSKVDLDIIAIRELLRFPSSTNNQMAQLYYRYGRAAVIDDGDFSYDVLSLQEMARSEYRVMFSPYFEEYRLYHEQDYYADKTILDMFDGEGKWRSDHIVSTLQYSVVVEYMMGLLGLTERYCEEGLKSPTHSWDAFAALYIGSLEGVDIGGSDETIDGVMLWNLSNKRAVQFNTQNKDYFSIVNDEMLDLLFAGQSELGQADCANFEKTTSRVLHLMLLPLIQSTIWYAIQNEKLEENSADNALTIGHCLAMSVLPIVEKYDQYSARVIERNMIPTEGVKPVQDGAQFVANAFFQVMDEIGWGCEYIGQSEGVDPCQLYIPKTKQESSGSNIKISNSHFVVALLCSIFFVGV